MNKQIYFLTPFSDLLDKILISVEANLLAHEVVFTCQDNTIYKLYHGQDCCEEVRLEDVTGDINDLLNSPIKMAEVVSSQDDEQNFICWSFYKLATEKGYVTFRWMSDENSNYSTEVSFARLKFENKIT